MRANLLLFRQQWSDNRLAFNDQAGKIKYLTMTERSKVNKWFEERQALSAPTVISTDVKTCGHGWTKESVEVA